MWHPLLKPLFVICSAAIFQTFIKFNSIKVIKQFKIIFNHLQQRAKLAEGYTTDHKCWAFQACSSQFGSLYSSEELINALGWNHTSYLSLFLHGQIFGLNFCPHGKCLNRDKIDFSTKQRRLQLNRFCKKKAQITFMPRQNSVSYTISFLYISKISSHSKFLHI